MDCTQARILLQSYVDGELEAGQAALINEHLHGCTACATLAERSRSLHRVLAQIVPLSAPAALRERIRGQMAAPENAAPEKPALRWYLAPALLGAMAACLMITWFVARWSYMPSSRELLVHDLVAAHLRSLLPGHLTDVLSSDHHTVKPWFTGRLDYAPWVGDLAGQGFPLIGGRVDYIAGRRVAVLVYQHGQHVINVVISPDAENRGESVSLTSSEGYHVVSWNWQGQTFTAISDMDAAELNSLADAVRGFDGKKP